MSSQLTGVRNAIESFGYKVFFKPQFFKQDPEVIHDRMLKLGESVANNPGMSTLTKMAFGYKNSMLNQTVDGIKYDNPLGLAAGFDKNAQLVGLTPLIGFGFEEIGSITGEVCPGNDKPRLWRLPKSQSLVVYYGLMNDGAEALSKKLQSQEFKIPIGVSIAKTNSPDTATMESGARDYAKAYRLMKDIGQYVTINISCPNAFGGQPFTDKKSLGHLLSALDDIRVKKPHYIKLSPDLSDKQLNDIIDLAAKYHISGFITSNLTKNRQNSRIVETKLPEKGGLSGKVVQQLADKQLSGIRKKTGSQFTLIGCGGVFSAEDAYHKITHGASLIQLITGMIYQGPQQISEINRGLVKLLQRDGHSSISDAVGTAID